MDTQLPSIQDLLDQYRFAVMCNLDNKSSIEEAIRSCALAAAEEQINKARESAEANRETLDLAYTMGRKGIEKASLEFQDFLTKIKEDQDTVLVEAVLSCHDRGMAAFYDEYCNDIASEDENGELPEENREGNREQAKEPAIQDNTGDNGNAPLEEPVKKELSDQEHNVVSEKMVGDLLDTLNGNAFEQKESDHTAEISTLLKKIKKYRTWNNDYDKSQALNEAVERIRQLSPSQGEEAQKLLDVGKQIVAIFDKAWKAGTQNDKEALNSLIIEAQQYGVTPYEMMRIQKNFDTAWNKVKMIIAEKKAKKKNNIQPKLTIPAYSVEVTHPFFLGNMLPSKRWYVFIDETGSIFDRTVFNQGIKSGDKGKFVALFIPENSELPTLKYHHATDASTQANQTVLQTLFTKGHGCGILGVTLEAMPNAPLDYWYAGLERLIALSLRFLPDITEKTILEFFVENRGGDSEADIDKSKAVIKRTAETCLYHFAKSYPAKADMLDLKIHNIPKKQTDNQVFLAYNGYVDTIACAWNGKRKELLGMLKEFGLCHRCLLEGNAQELPFVMDRVACGESIPLEQWNKLLVSPDIGTKDSPVAMLMDKQGYATRNNVDTWMHYVEDVVGHLNSKAIRLTLLSKQLAWLTENMPAVTNMPKRLKLIWLTSQLAEANHHGIIAPKILGELNRLVSEIYVEDAPLSCWAVLNLAVEKTNAYRFEEARQIIRDFAEKGSLFREEPPFSDYLAAIQDGHDGIFDPKVAVYGLRYYGQMLSSLGQHEAFLGNHEKANSYLEAAIQCFRQLSENSGPDISQTSSYLVTNLMDYQDAQTVLPKLEEYLGGPLEEVAGQLVGSSKPQDKYRHFMMLRYFQNLPKDHPAIKTYLAGAKSWKTDAGHPWEMIEFYRAMLLDDKQECWKHINKAYDIARTESGPTMLVIACVILGAARYLNDRLSVERYTQCINSVIQLVPGLGEKRINALRAQASNPMEPLALAKIVLPFNFR